MTQDVKHIALQEHGLQTRHKFTIDEALNSNIGQFGKGQQFLWVIASIGWIPAACQTLVMIFMASDPIEQELWQCKNSNSSVCMEIYYGQKADELSTSEVQKDLCDSSFDFEWEWTHPHRSIISDFGLHCEEWLGQVTNSLFFLGFLVGAGIFGWYADKYGRRHGLLIVLLLSVVFGGLNSAAWSLWSYIIFRFLVGAAVAGIGLVSFILAHEPLGAKWRGWAGVMNGCFFGLGEMVLALFAYFIRPWRLLNLVCVIVSLIYLLVVYVWKYPLESARWWLVHEQHEKAYYVLQKTAQLNGTEMPQGQLIAHEYTLNNAQNGEKASLKDVFYNLILRRRILVLMYAWCVVSAGYYGIQLSLGALGGNPYFNIFLMGFVEIISYVIGAQLVEKIGRNALIVWGLWICGFACLITGPVPQGTIRVIFALIGKFGASIAFNTLFMYTVELFPTVVRSKSLGTCSLSARLGGIAAPGIVALGTFFGTVTSFAIFGISTIVAGILLVFLPETLGSSLMETFEDLQKGPNQLSKYTLMGLCGTRQQQYALQGEQELEMANIRPGVGKP
eukprot:TRINITY_DN6395_c1_g2_i2.p1 TRINITY_DN6395_c1_g2~~TRINITY_DN6395_c1_g2_i2.p1  ORF type:complete len:599 (+),score=48.29 TRINITY_DN6395_c1_g2_i2:117-1799(+)